MYQVLLVDDEPILQLGIRRMLEGAADYQICASARNGEEALQYLQAHPVDIVMTDLKMPVMDGTRSSRSSSAASCRRRSSS